MGVAVGLAGLACLVLIFQRWFWGIAFGLGSLVSCLELLVGIVHFQVLKTSGYFFLMLICWSIAKAISEEPPAQHGNVAPASSGADGPDWSPH